MNLNWQKLYLLSAHHQENFLFLENSKLLQVKDFLNQLPFACLYSSKIAKS
jgi:hypothetical protein